MTINCAIGSLKVPKGIRRRQPLECRSGAGCYPSSTRMKRLPAGFKHVQPLQNLSNHATPRRSATLGSFF